VGGVKKQALRLTGFDLSLIFLAAFVAFLIGYFHIVL
jgi:hypothetical protein